MAKVSKDDIFDGADFRKAADDIEVFNAALKQTQTVINAINKEQQKNPLKTSQDVNSRIKATEELNRIYKLQTSFITQRDAAVKKSQKIAEDDAKAKAKQAKETEKVTKATEKQAKEQAKANNLYAQASKRLNELRLQYKNLVLSGKENEVGTKKLKEEILKLDASLKKVDADVGQFNRNIGNYKESVKEALQETGIFSGRLGGLINSLSQTKQKLDEAKKAGEGFGTALKITGVGLALAAVKILLELTNINQAALDLKERGQAILKDLGPGEGFLELVKATQLFRKEVRGLNLDLQALNQDQQDLNEIASDATLGFKTREEAAKQALATEKLASELQLEISKRELGLIDKEIKARESVVGAGNATNDLLDKRNELLLKVGEAQDRVNDAQRKGEEKLREIQQKELANTINVIQTQTQVRLDALDKQLANEKKQIEERRKIAQEEERISSNSFNLEISKFNEVLGKKINGNELLKIQNADLLQQALDSLDIGDKAQDALLKVITARQKELASIKDANAKLDQEEIERQRTILKIQTERTIEAKRFTVEQRQSDVEQSAESIEKNREKIFEDENAFNRKLLKARELLVEGEKENREELFNEQLSLIELERQADINEAEKTINDQKILAEKKIQIEENYQREKEKIGTEFQAKELERQQEIAKQNEEILNQQLKIVAKNAGQLLDAISSSLDKRAEREQEAIDKRQEANETEIDRQRDLAERGLTNQLAFEEQKKAQLELAEQAQAQKEKNRELLLGFLKSWQGYAETDPNTALSKAFKDLAIAKGADVLFAATGAENIDGAGTATSDSIPSMLSKGESVITAKGTSEAPGLATAWNNGMLNEYIVKTYLPKTSGSFAENVYSSAMLHKLDAVKSELQAVKQAIYNKPETTVQLNNLGEVIESKVIAGVTKRITFKNRKRI